MVALSSGVQTPTGMAQMKRNRVLLGGWKGSQGKEKEEYRQIEEDEREWETLPPSLCSN